MQRTNGLGRQSSPMFRVQRLRHLLMQASVLEGATEMCDLDIRVRQSPRKSNIGAAMKTEELAAIRMANAIGTAKLSTALPPQIAIGNSAIRAPNRSVPL